MSPQITALVAQKRNPQRINVFLDGQFAFGLFYLTAAWLRPGQELSEEKIAELQSADGREAAYQQALRLLETRPRSIVEIRRNLEKHEYPAEVIAVTLERLQSAGLADDAHFAREWVENRSTFRPRSRRALAFELRQKGVDESKAQQAIAAVDDDAAAYDAASRYGRKIASADRDTFLRRMVGYLGRRGFGYEAAKMAAQRVWRELAAESSSEFEPDRDDGES